MATFSGAQANFGLNCNGTPTKTLISGVSTIGQLNTRVGIDTGDIGYAFRCVFAATSATISFATDTGTVTPSATLTAGAAQVETATVIAASGITANGTATVSITSGVIAGASTALIISVPVTTAQNTAALLATTLRAGIAAVAAVVAHYTVGGTGATITLTRNPVATITGLPIYYATDASLNISTANGSCTGITAAATSTGTLAGTATSGVQVYDGDGKDWDGTAINCTPTWVLFKVTAGTVSWTDGYSETGIMYGDVAAGTYQVRLLGGTKETQPVTSPITFTAAAGPAEITVTVIGTKA